MKKLLFSLILSLLPIASGAIQYEYFNPLMPQNGALKVNQTIGQLTPPQGKGFGVLSALTNLQSVASSIATNEYGIQVDTLGLVCPTEDAVAAAISAHNTDQSAHSYIQNRITVNDNAIAANADAIQKTREDFMAADTELQTQITAHAGELTTLRNDLDDLGDEVAVIEGKIPASTTSSNQLVNASQLAAEEQDIRDDMNQADSELQTQITANANNFSNYRTSAAQDTIDADLQSQITAQVGSITTLRNDIDDLGDQVAGIEGKIPASTTSSNQLVNASQLTAESQDIRSEFAQADSELQQQINAHATAITNLEDGVDSINGKIPTNASTTNLLVSTSQLNTEIQDVRADFMADDAALQTQINGQATTIAGIQDDITGINSKISASASSTNKLISASELSATEQDIRADMNEADSQLQTQITAQAGSITTLRNDTDDLGDQVAGIEGKIPAAASSSNQLALNSQITSLQTQITTNTNNFTNYRTSAAQDVIDSNLQTQITANANNFTNYRTSDAQDAIDSNLQTQITANANNFTNYRTSDAQDAIDSDLQTQITANANKFSNYRTSAAQDTIDADLQSQITAEQSARQSADTTLQNNITNGLALKLDKNQGSANQGKILSVGSDGQITLTAAPGGGLQVVAHNSTLTGAGTDASPLGIASSVLSELADKADQTVVDALASTVSSIQTDYTPKATTTALSNTVSGIQSDYVSKTATAAQTIVSSLQMPELTVGTAEGTLNLSITAGVATIATNNGLDIISQTKFDTLPTTDDTTTWANALDANLVSKAQVASALSELPTGANLPILMSVWSDHLLNDMSWLRADTFSWQSGDVYVAAYQHLANEVSEVWYAWEEIGGGVWVYTKTPTVSDGDTVYDEDFSVYGQVDTVTSATRFIIGSEIYLRSATDDIPFNKTDTIGGITIKYALSEDGHKICLPDQESNIAALYQATGVAWYYILDTTNKQFKLPRTKYSFTGLRDSVGGYVAPGLPNITGQVSQIDFSGSRSFSGAFIDVNSPSGDTGATHSGGTRTTVGFDASKSSAIYGNSTTVQPPATQMYLYFYVGNFEQPAIEQTAGITAETLNGKVDLPTGKAQSDVDFVVESQLPTSANGYTWYRKYKSGWVEQGGLATIPGRTNMGSSSTDISLPVIMADANYTPMISITTGGAYWASAQVSAREPSTTTIRLIAYWNVASGTFAALPVAWTVSGMSAQ